MAINWVIQNVSELTLTATQVTFGFLPGQTNPVDNLVLVSSGAGLVILPQIETLLPSNTNSNYQLGSGSVKISVKSLTAQNINFTVSASTDKIFDGTVTMTSTGNVVTWLASLSDLTWYRF